MTTAGNRNEQEKAQALIRLVDDDVRVREALSLMLGIEGWTTKAYGSAREFLVDDDSTRPGCLILDVRMPGMTGLELQNAMLTRGLNIPILFLTGHADIDVAIQSLKKGAVDFLLKPVDDEKLLHAIEDAVHKDAVNRAGLNQQALRAQVDSLSERERDLIEHIARGQTDSQMASSMMISERTVQGHRAKIYRKFGIHSARALEMLLPDILALIHSGR